MNVEFRLQQGDADFTKGCGVLDSSTPIRSVSKNLKSESLNSSDGALVVVEHRARAMEKSTESTMVSAMTRRSWRSMCRSNSCSVPTRFSMKMPNWRRQGQSRPRIVPASVRAWPPILIDGSLV